MPAALDSAENHALRADAYLKDDDYTAAALEADRALEILPVLAHTAVIRGKAQLSPLLDLIMSEDKASVPHPQEFKPAWESFTLAARLEPGNAEAQHELERMQSLLKVADARVAEAENRLVSAMQGQQSLRKHGGGGLRVVHRSSGDAFNADVGAIATRVVAGIGVCFFYLLSYSFYVFFLLTLATKIKIPLLL